MYCIVLYVTAYIGGILNYKEMTQSEKNEKKYQ